MIFNGLLECYKCLAGCSAKITAEGVKSGTVKLEEYLEKLTWDRVLV